MEELRKLALEVVPEEYRERFFYSFEGGKRVRPLLMKGVCSRLGREFSPLRKAALAAELLHCATLLHDDALDSGQGRRG